MSTTTNRVRAVSISTKISIATFLLVSLVFGLYTWAIGRASAELIERRATKELSVETKAVIDMIDIFNNAVTKEVIRSGKQFANNFPAKFSLDTSRSVMVSGKPTPVLKNGEAELNMDFTVPDKFTAGSGVPATIFAKSGDDFIRVSTSLKKENGDRAIGTVLDRTHPAYQLLSGGQSYSGIATLFGKDYITNYDPIRDERGGVIGVLFVGVDISDAMQTLKEKIKSIKVGSTGYFYILNTKPGADLGKLILHPAKQGQNLIDAKDGNGRPFIKNMLEQKKGEMRYPWMNTELGETSQAEKIVMFDVYPRWNWMVAGGAYTSEFTQDVNDLSKRYTMFGILAVLMLVGLLFMLVRLAVIRPLLQVTAAAQQLATGDLTLSMQVTRKDEIGLLQDAMNGISDGLSRVIAQVRQATSQIGVSSGEIATGNSDLSARTESQASSLEETSSAMEQLASTVKQNADNARHANQLVQSASAIALRGGETVHGVVQTMGSIKASSSKIVDIISVIDGIAFQTNILALNAAVEAARAGEQGRGFAVVATEVRNLAQRSASAAKEIKTLISDSVDKVDTGSKLVDEAGTTMDDIVAAVRQVTDIMSEITAASSEQSTGIDHINQAIIQIDGMTQQNAALVEQASAAAMSMEEQSQQLTQLVETFRIDAGRYGAPAAPAARTVSARSSVSAAPKKLPAASRKLAPARQAGAVATSRNTAAADEWEEF